MYLLPLLLAVTQVTDLQGVAVFAEGETDGTAVTADGRIETAPILVKSGEVPGAVLKAFADGSVLLSEPLRWLDASGKPILNLAHKALGDGCRQGKARYAVAGPKGELLYAADGRGFKLLSLPKAHAQIWAVDCGANKGAWVAASEPSVAYHVVGEKIIREVPLPGLGLRSIVARAAEVYVGELSSGRVWDLSGKKPRVIGHTANPEVMALGLGPAGTGHIYALSVSSDGSAEGKVPVPSPRSRGGGTVELIRNGRPQAVLWSSDGETPLTILLTEKDVLVGTDLGFIYSFPTVQRADGSSLAASGAQRRFAVRDKRAVEALAMAKDGLLAFGGGLRRSEVKGEPHRYLSKILDAGLRANWGSLRSQSRHVKAVRWRFGEDPEGEGWTDWTDQPGGQSRYAQLEVILKPGGSLTRLEQFHTPMNRAPEVTSITVLAAGTRLEEKPDSFDFDKGFTLPEMKLDDFFSHPQKAAGPGEPEQRGAVRWQAGHRGVIWEAKDPDEDPLRFRVELRKLDKKGGHEVVSRQELARPYLSLKTSVMAGGSYQLGVQAEDTSGALSPTRRSLVIVVDHKAPRLKVLVHDVKKGRLVIEATDSDRILALICHGQKRTVRLQPRSRVADAKILRFELPQALSSIVKDLSRCEAVDPSGNRRSIILD